MGLISRNRLSQNRNTCCGTSRSSATSLMVRKASVAFSTTAPIGHTALYSLAGSLELELMRCLRMADGLNTITRRGEIGTSFPVLGLRPTRCPFLRTTTEPKDDNFTVSPRSRQSVISLSTSSTNAEDSVRDRPTFWYTASHKSARVTVFPVIAQPQSRQRSS